MGDVERGLLQTTRQTGGERLGAQARDQRMHLRFRLDGVGAVGLGGILAIARAAENAVVGGGFWHRRQFQHLTHDVEIEFATL